MADMSTTGLLLERVAQDPAGRLIAIPDAFGGWFDITAAEFLARVRGLAKGLLTADIHLGDRIGVLCSNRFDATLVDFAAGMVGAATVPLRAAAGHSELLSVLDDADIRAMIVETANDFARFDELHGDLPGVFTVWQIDLGDLDKLARAGLSVADETLDARTATVEPGTAAGVLYSMADGELRHSVLRHGALAERSRDLAAVLAEATGPEKSVLQILPATDVHARVTTLVAVATGTRLGHLHSPGALIETMASFRPTLMVAPPEAFAEIDERARARSDLSGRSVSLRQALDVAVELSEARSAGAVSRGLRTRFALADALVLRGLRKAVGGRLTHAVCVATDHSLPRRLRHVMNALDVRVLEGFGTADTTGIAVIERFGDPFERPPGTVGAPLAGIEVLVADDGEIALRGPGVGGTAATTGEDDDWLPIERSGSLIDGRLVIDGRDVDELPSPADAVEPEPDHTGSSAAADF